MTGSRRRPRAACASAGLTTFTKQRLPPRSNRPAQDVWAVKLSRPKPDRLSKSRKPSRRDRVDELVAQ